MTRASYSFKWNQSRVSRLRTDTLRAMVTAAIGTSNAAKRGAPYDSGALVNSIRVDTTKQNEIFVLAGGNNAGKKVPYAKRREYENKKNPQRKFYMHNAFKQLEQNYTKYFKGIAK